MIDLEKIHQIEKKSPPGDFLQPENGDFSFFDWIFAAANAAATTRLSDGNEKVFRKFAPEK